MSDLICGKAAVGGNYNSTRDSLRNHYSDISKQCREQKEAVIITVNGRGDTVSISYEEYKNMKARIELLEILAEAEDDVKNGRVALISESFDDLRAILQEE